MNKLFIVLLAVCLINVNAASVKREAENPINFDAVSGKAQDLLKDLQRQISGLNPEQIKKAFSDSVDNINKLFEAGKQGEAKQ